MAGLMMFGKGIAIREVCPQFRSDYLDRQGIEPGSSEKWNDRLTDDGTWEHNMYVISNRISFGKSLCSVTPNRMMPPCVLANAE